MSKVRPARCIYMAHN